MSAVGDEEKEGTTTDVKAEDLRAGDYVVLRSRPCKITSVKVVVVNSY